MIEARFWLALGWVWLFAACASAPVEEAPERPFIKLAARGLGLWVHPSPSIDPKTAEELELYLAAELERLYQTPPLLSRLNGTVSPLDAGVLTVLADGRVADVVIVEPRAGAGGLGARVSVLTVTDERVALRFELEPRSREQGSAERLARRIADRLGTQFTDPGAGPAFDGLVVADRLAERGACAAAVRIYERDLPKSTSAKESVAVATREYEHRIGLERCRARLVLAAKRAADRTARFALSYDLERVDPSFHPTVRQVGARAGLEAELRKLTDKPAIIELGKSSLLLHLRHHPERYKKFVGRARSVHRDQPAIFFEAWQPALTAMSRMAEGLAEAIPGVKVETYLRLTTLEGDWLEIGFARMGPDGALRVSDRLTVHQTGVAQDTVIESSSTRDLRSLVFVLGPPKTLDGKSTVYGPAVDFLEL